MGPPEEVKGHPLGFSFRWKFHRHPVKFVRCCVINCSQGEVLLWVVRFFQSEYRDLELDEWCFELLEKLRFEVSLLWKA